MIAAVPTVFSRQLLFVTLHIYGQSTVKSRLFRRIFAVILTDNGSEFKHTRELETTEAGKKGFNRCPAGLFLLWITFSTASNFALSVSTRAVS